MEENLFKFERFTNDDYSTLCNLDFRSVRYKKDTFYSSEENTEEAEYFVKEKMMKRTQPCSGPFDSENIREKTKKRQRKDQENLRQAGNGSSLT